MGWHEPRHSARSRKLGARQVPSRSDAVDRFVNCPLALVIRDITTAAGTGCDRMIDTRPYSLGLRPLNDRTMRPAAKVRISSLSGAQRAGVGSIRTGAAPGGAAPISPSPPPFPGRATPSADSPAAPAPTRPRRRFPKSRADAAGRAPPAARGPRIRLPARSIARRPVSPANGLGSAIALLFRSSSPRPLKPARRRCGGFRRSARSACARLGDLFSTCLDFYFSGLTSRLYARAAPYSSRVARQHSKRPCPGMARRELGIVPARAVPR